MEHELTLGGVHDSPDAVQPSDNHQHILGHHSIISLTQDLDLGCGPDVIQACMMPCTSTGLPVMGKLPRTDNVYVCTGHGCWGILCGPFSGLIMSDLIADDTCSRINLSAFKPTVNC